MAATVAPRRQLRLARDVVALGMQHHLHRAGEGVVGPGQVSTVAGFDAQAHVTARACGLRTGAGGACQQRGQYRAQSMRARTKPA
ncbi:MAG: hypothetical protein L0H23_05130 [Luteimonas sp.]|nr:hypothetical protein [Luteimonas sp.]